MIMFIAEFELNNHLTLTLLFVALGFEMVKKVLKKCNLNRKEIVQGVKPLLTKITSVD
jgi:uncharacterized membrane protein YhdT